MGTGMRTRASATLVAIAGLVSFARGAVINYGNFGPIASGITFQQVTESSTTDAVPLYGPPSPFPIGLDFNPIGFGSSASGGISDITEGQLNFTVSGNSTGNTLVEITSLKLFESGDYTLTGAGTGATAVSAGAILRATITEINGSPVAPLNIGPFISTFSDSLPGAVTVAPWQFTLFVDVDAALIGLGYTANDGATKVEVVINNTLTSSSEAGTAASIAKKDFQITAAQGFVLVIPEPAMLSLAGVAAMALMGRVRRFR